MKRQLHLITFLLLLSMSAFSTVYHVNIEQDKNDSEFIAIRNNTLPVFAPDFDIHATVQISKKFVPNTDYRTKNTKHRTKTLILAKKMTLIKNTQSSC